MELREKMKIVPILNTANYGDGVDFDSIDMKNYHHATVVLTFGAITGNAVLTVNTGTTNAAKTRQMTLGFRYGATATIGSTSSDVLTSVTAAASHTMTGATYQNRIAIFEIPADKMTAGDRYLTLALSNAATNGICHAVAILWPRYSGNVMATAV